MRIFTTVFEAGRKFPRAVVAIGKFDALHVGHRKIIGAALKAAKAKRLPCLVMTFDPAADQFVRLYPYRPILPLAKRIEMLRRLGVDGVVLLPFDENLACLSPEAFARDVLCRQLKASCLFVGTNFCFGKDRAGDVATLKEQGRSLGFSVRVLRLSAVGRKNVSAAAIRRLIDSGKRTQAEKMLGRRL